MGLFSYVGEMSVDDLERERNKLLEGIRKARGCYTADELDTMPFKQIQLDAASTRIDMIEKELDIRTKKALGL